LSQCPPIIKISLIKNHKKIKKLKREREREREGMLEQSHCHSRPEVNGGLIVLIGMLIKN
jgi:hypothetical protein